MSDFASHSSTAEDWSLQAIVRGSSGEFTKLVGVEEMEGRDSFFGPYDSNYQKLEDDHDFLASFSELFEVSNGSSDELEELYKPFYPVGTFATDVASQFQQKSTETMDPMVEEDKKLNLESDQSSAAGNYAACSRDGYTPKYKRRKNQHKRVVIQVSAEGLTSDMWAWRKYGQKPIKGSPYPRSYYRCSSLKGCLARKQVEQSCTEPGMFIVTYTAEHSHSKPTRRNSLAGTVRQKFPSNKANNNNGIIKQEEKIDGSSSRKDSMELAADKARVASNDLHARIKQEEQQVIICHDDQGQERFDFDRGDGLNYAGNDDDLMFNGDFFSGLEDFNDFISGSGASSFHSIPSVNQQFQVRL